MREFIYYSQRARTSGNFNTDDLMKAGRMDIVCNVVIMSFFVSHHMRQDTKLHLIFNGPPDAPKHLELFPGENQSPELGEIKEKIDISKKDVAGLIKKMLYKYKGRKTEVAKGYSIEKKSFINVVKELKEQGKKVCLMDRRGEDVRSLNNEELKNCVFVIGDHEGLPKQELKRLKEIGVKKISIGRETYFASQTFTILQNELDRRG